LKKFSLFLIFLFFFNFNALAADLRLLTEDAPPGNFIENGELKGYSIDIVNEILTRLNQDIKIEMLPWARAYKIALEQPDIALFATTRTESREHLFKWVGPLKQVKWILIAKKGNPVEINSLDDAKKVNSIGTYREDARDQFLRKQGFTNLVPVIKNSQNLRMLLNERIDLVIITDSGFVKQSENMGVPLDEFEVKYVIKTRELYIAFSIQTNDGIVRQWASVFDQLEKEGFVKRTVQKWSKGL